MTLRNMEEKMNQNNLFDTSMNRRDALKTMGKAAMAGAMLSTVPGMGEAALSNFARFPVPVS